jgi:arylsulfatase A-like enzyme
MKHYHLLVLLCLCHSGWVHAEIYKRVDAQGHVTYSSDPIKGGKKLDLKPLPTMSGASQRSTPADFPKVDTQTQRSRDDTRRVILQDELATEEKLLATARENLTNIENNPESRINAAGIPFRQTAEYTEKVKAAQETVALHEQNIKALRTEILNLKQ